MLVRNVAVALIVASGWTTAPNVARAADTPSLAGTYDCVGTNANGSQYTGIVEISRVSKTSDTYNLEWTIAGSSYVGVAIVEAERLCSSWAIPVDGQVIVGVVVYKIEKGKLVGRWTQYPGGGQVMTETLTLRD